MQEFFMGEILFEKQDLNKSLNGISKKYFLVEQYLTESYLTVIVVLLCIEVTSNRRWIATAFDVDNYR